MTAVETIGRFCGALHPDWDTPAFRNWLTQVPHLPAIDRIDLGNESVFRVPTPGRPPLVLKNLPSAQHAFETALALQQAGVPTPPPIAWLVASTNPQEQYLLAELLPGTRTLREALLQQYYEKPLCSAIMDLLFAAADAVRRLHEAGFSHDNLSNHNLLVAPNAEGRWEKAWILDPSFIRRHSAPLRDAERGRDNARITLPSDLRRVFHEMQYAPALVPRAFRRAEDRQRRREALLRRIHRLSKPFRPASRPIRDYPPERDLWIWDDRSMQAIPSLRGKDKRKYYQRRDLLPMVQNLCRYGPPLRKACRELMAGAFSQPVDLAGRVGLSLNLEPERFEKERRWLSPLGTLPLLVRLYHHETEARRRFAIDAIRKLQSEGHRVSVALVQDRKAVLFPDKWRDFVEGAGAALSGFVESFEICHAVNRVKWGIWTNAEHRALLAPFAGWSARFPQIPLIGPAGIDFEYPRILPLLDHLPPGETWSAFSHHLYVDRRGFPENEQSGYDTVRKLALARAIARIHPRCQERVIVSEVNWPLKDTGVWSPVGSPYQSPGERHNDPSVDEDTYAACMVRYFLLALCSGMADRVYWWNLAAHGFGLIDDRSPGAWRPRPAYHEFKRLAELSRSAIFQHREDRDGTIRLSFQRKDNSRLHIDWDPKTANIPNHSS